MKLKVDGEGRTKMDERDMKKMELRLRMRKRIEFEFVAWQRLCGPMSSTSPGPQIAD